MPTSYILQATTKALTDKATHRVDYIKVSLQQIADFKPEQADDAYCAISGPLQNEEFYKDNIALMRSEIIELMKRYNDAKKAANQNLEAPAKLTI